MSVFFYLPLKIQQEKNVSIQFFQLIFMKYFTNLENACIELSVVPQYAQSFLGILKKKCVTLAQCLSIILKPLNIAIVWYSGVQASVAEGFK